MKRTAKAAARRRSKLLPAAKAAISHSQKPKLKKQISETEGENEASKSIELLLIKRIASSEHDSCRPMNLQDLVYNFTPETKRYAYKSGFATGELAAIHFPGALTLERILAAAGLGKVIYYPFPDAVKITSARKMLSFSFGTNSHMFESGLIAGFLSKETGRRVEAIETHCMLNNSSFCQFEASRRIDPYLGLTYIGRFDKLSELLAEGIDAEPCSFNSDYYLISLLPLLQKPLLNSVSKLMYILGKRLGEERPEAKSEIPKILRYLHIPGNVSENMHAINLQYPHELSMSGFVLLSTFLLRGYIATAMKLRSSLLQRVSKGAYIVSIKTE
ncbi:MAG: V4R domain-containing protein [Candidatus Micrarchaeia archaeon]